MMPLPWRRTTERRIGVRCAPHRIGDLRCPYVRFEEPAGPSCSDPLDVDHDDDDTAGRKAAR